MKNTVRLTESDLNRLIERIVSEQVPQQKRNVGAVRSTPAKDFIQTLYDIADKYKKVNITLNFDGKYIVGTENNSGQKFMITIT
jgi:hypothetical protein